MAGKTFVGKLSRGQEALVPEEPRAQPSFLPGRLRSPPVGGACPSWLGAVLRAPEVAQGSQSHTGLPRALGQRDTQADIQCGGCFTPSRPLSSGLPRPPSRCPQRSHGATRRTEMAEAHPPSPEAALLWARLSERHPPSLHHTVCARSSRRRDGAGSPGQGPESRQGEGEEEGLLSAARK